MMQRYNKYFNYTNIWVSFFRNLYTVEITTDIINTSFFR